MIAMMFARKGMLCTILIFLFFALIAFESCSKLKKNSTHLSTDDESIEKGKTLATQYCGSCHMLPDPSLLDTKSWEKGILPFMGPRLGIFEYASKRYPSAINDVNIGLKFYPSRPLLAKSQWQNILDYYEALSPDSLPGQKRKYPISKDLKLFKARWPEASSFKYFNPAISYIKIDTTIQPHDLFVCDVNRNNIMRIDQELNPVDSVFCGGPVVDMVIQNRTLLYCNVGILYPKDGKFGSAGIVSLQAPNNLRYRQQKLFDSLQRPVQIIPSDFNADGKEDYLVCEFGNLTGALSWVQNKSDGNFQRHILENVPGSIKACITDYNHDRLPDFYVLFAQGNESIALFINEGNGKFHQRQVLQFPPSYGSSYFELADFNVDGHPDILYTCGDNADYTPVLKPYHGVYIFMNDGNDHFTEKYFFPINGCYKAMARDFDNDGDLDIAAIAFFADYTRQPEEGFVYLENRGQFDFKPFSLPETELGRWLTMDAGDFDGDGRIDIALGNFSAQPIEKSEVDWQHQPAFLLLLNAGR